MSRSHPLRAAGMLLGLAASCVLCSGCVYSQFTVTTTPPGAIVQVNGKTVGPTPVDVPFLYHGTYELTVFREGFQTMKIKQPVPAPWYEWGPLEFVSEHLIPWTILDKRQFHFDLLPLQVPSPEVIQARAQVLREEGKGIGAPLPSSVMPILVPVQRPPLDSFETLPNPNPSPAPNAGPPAGLPPAPPPMPVLPTLPSSGS